MRILLAESDKAVAQSIELMLKSEIFNVYTTNHGGEAVDLGKMYDYDAILLGDTPDLTGCDMLRSLRLAKVNSPIIVFGRTGVEHVVQALGTGADDYLTKPFHKDELVARIHAIVRRSKGHPVSVIQVGNLAVNITTKTASVNGQQIHLTGKEYGILELLSLRKGLTISKEMLLNHLYGGMDEPEIKIIDVFICKIRKKLRAVEGQDVETVWGRGYVLRDAAQQSPSLAPELSEMAAGTGAEFVPMRTFSDHRRDSIVAGKIKAPSLVPEAGQK